LFFHASFLWRSFIASGCYDGNLRIWPGVAAAASAGSLSDQEPLALGAAHSAAIKGVCWVNSAEAAHADVVHSCVTASKDRTIRVWQVLDLIDSSS
jgi:WD40 repeat protein